MTATAKFAVTKPGIYQMPMSAYQDDPAPAPSLSSHVASALIDQTPQHAWAMHPRLNTKFFQRQQKREFDRGTAAHACLLESGDEIVVFDCDSWRKPEDARARDACYDRWEVPLLARQMVEVERMAFFAREQIKASEHAKAWRYGVSERVLVWQEGDVWCRARLDRWYQKGAVIFDYKTTDGLAAPPVWGGRALWQGPDIQEAFYRRGAKALTGRAHAFHFVVQETAFPYCLSFNAPDAAAQKEGDEMVEEAIRRFGEHLRSGNWPAYPGQTAYHSKPSYRTYQWEEEKARQELSESMKRRAAALQAPLDRRFDA